MAMAVLLGWGMHIVLLLGTQRNGPSPSSRGATATTGGKAGVGGGAAADSAGVAVVDDRNSILNSDDVRRQTPEKEEGQVLPPGRQFRQLNLMGFEREDGEGGEWKTCRSYEEEALTPHKQVGGDDYSSYYGYHTQQRAGLNRSKRTTFALARRYYAGT